MDRELAIHAAEVLKAVAHPVRLLIVGALQNGEQSVSQIISALG